MKTQKDKQIQRDALDLSRRKLIKAFGLGAADKPGILLAGYQDLAPSRSS